MKQILIISLLLSTAFLACTPKTGEQLGSSDPFRKGAPAPGPAPKIELGDYDQFQLDNGLKVIVVENHKLPRVSFQVFVDAPEVVEGELAGFIETAGALLTKGTTTRTKSQIDEAVDYMGASLTSSGSGLFASCLSKHSDGLLSLMSDVLLNPSFPQDEFDKMKKQTISGLVAAKSNPDAIAQNVGSVLNFGKNHPYGVIQTEASTEKITIDVCKAYYQTYFRPNISYLIVVGDVKPDAAREMAKKYFGNWESREIQKLTHPTPKAPDESKVVFVDKAGAVQSVVHVTYPVDLKPGTPDVIPARVMNVALGGYFGSRLMSNLREDKAFTYGSTSTLNNDHLAGYFLAQASVRNEVTDSAMTQILLELDRLRNEKVEDAELTMVKNYMSGGFARSLESPQTVATFALNTVRFNLPDDYYATYLERLAAVSADDVLNMAKKYLHPDKAWLLVVGSKSAVSAKLTPFDKGGKVQFFDTYGNALPDEDSTLPQGLNAAQVFEDYVTAIGGKDELAKVNSLKTSMSSDSPMGKFEIMALLKKPGNFLTTLSVGGNVMQKMVYNGEKGAMEQMGQKMPMDAETATSVKEDGVLFAELSYLERGFTATLVGIETIEGKKAYQIDLTSPSGRKKTLYYLTENSLKVREVEVQGEGEQATTITTDYGDYKKVNGVLVPHEMTLAGLLPMPLKFKMDVVELNGTVDAALFQLP